MTAQVATMMKIVDRGAVPDAVGLEDRSSVAATLRRFMYSKAYLAFYVVLLLLSIFSFIWFFVERNDTKRTWFLMLEIVLNIFLIVDIG